MKVGMLKGDNMPKIQGVEIKWPTRPCWVKGKKGLFHRYIDKTETVFINDFNVKPTDAEIAKEYFDNTKIIPNGFRVDKIVTTYALVEFEDGHMEEIQPTTITFLDNSEFKEFYWGDEECCMNCKYDGTYLKNMPCSDCKHNSWAISNGYSRFELKDTRK
jgi:hypothetical protein